MFSGNTFIDKLLINKIDCGGRCEVSGDVEGDIEAGGSVTCGNVSGDIVAGGSVRCRR